MSSLDSSTDVRELATLLDPRQLDAEYKSFPPFSEWSHCTVDTRRWDRYSALLKERRTQSPELLHRALHVARRAAAVDTGAIEGLYPVDRGFTLTVATQAAFWEARVDERGPGFRRLLESQLESYEYLPDLATQQVPLAEAWIRALHERICRGQDTYRALTPQGWQDVELPKGKYKHLPNHVIRRDGKRHAHAPVEQTPMEVFRLVEELRSEPFAAAHPVLQASYAHYALVVIHPFADGNGRVARALGSVFLLRALSIPFLVLVDQKNEYLSALESADDGNHQAFVDFVLERGLDAIQLVDLCLNAAGTRPLEESVTDLKRLYRTSGGYTHAEVDDAGYRLFDMVVTEFNDKVQREVSSNEINCTVSTDSARTTVEPPYRVPIAKGARRLLLNLSSAEPARTGVSRVFQLEVPKDCGVDDTIRLRQVATGPVFEARVSELFSTAKAALQMRISIFVEGILSDALADLARAAHTQLNKGGY